MYLIAFYIMRTVCPLPFVETFTNRYMYKIHCQMVRIKHFKASQIMVNFRIVQTCLMKEIPRNKTQQQHAGIGTL